ERGHRVGVLDLRQDGDTGGQGDDRRREVRHQPRRLHAGRYDGAGDARWRSQDLRALGRRDQGGIHQARYQRRAPALRHRRVVEGRLRGRRQHRHRPGRHRHGQPHRRSREAAARGRDGQRRSDAGGHQGLARRQARRGRGDERQQQGEGVAVLRRQRPARGAAREGHEADQGRRGADRPLVAALSVTETFTWGIVYYGFPVFLRPMEQDLGDSRVAVTAAFSIGLGVSALASISVGRWLDARGPRALMTAGSVLATALTFAWARVESLPALYAVWFLMGFAMAATLYEPAFAVVVSWFARGRDRALLTVTLVAGLASTIFMPIEAALLE